MQHSSEDDVCQISTYQDDPEAVARLEQMRSQAKTQESDELGLLSLQDLAQWRKEVEYDCHIWISLEVHATEIQYWENPKQLQEQYNRRL
jgi:hypothetical protein